MNNMAQDCLDFLSTILWQSELWSLEQRKLHLAQSMLVNSRSLNSLQNISMNKNSIMALPKIDMIIYRFPASSPISKIQFLLQMLKICKNVAELTEHHSNKLQLVEMAPITERGRELKKILALTMLSSVCVIRNLDVFSLRKYIRSSPVSYFCVCHIILNQYFNSNQYLNSIYQIFNWYSQYHIIFQLLTTNIIAASLPTPSFSKTFKYFG